LRKTKCIDCGKMPHKCECPHGGRAKAAAERKDFFAAEAMKEFIARRRDRNMDRELMSAIAQEAWEMAEEMTRDD
jgi:hypothetical protein